MTNKDKFLRDGVDLDDFANEMSSNFGIATQRSQSDYDVILYLTDVKKWLKAKVKPTLTEDERVILRNIKIRGINAEYIERTRNTGYLRVGSRSGAAGVDVANIDMYSHMFQFIKEGEEYSIEELLNDQ